MNVIKLNHSKYALKVNVAGKVLLLALNGELLSFDSKDKAEEMKTKIQNKVRQFEAISFANLR